jgi:DNA anti-recombination protein RmuC
MNIKNPESTKMGAEDRELEYMRMEVQKIIDNHLKDTGESFSVMNYNRKELLLLIDLLTGDLSLEELENKHGKDKAEFMKTYEEINNSYNYISQIINQIKETKSDLNGLKSELELDKQLNNI